jgi:DNA-binding transcriptional regulator YiaG
MPVQHAFLMTATIKRADRDRMRQLARATTLSTSGEGRKIREASGVSLPPLALAIGASVPTLSRWERGLSKPRGDAAVRWVKALEDLALVTAGGGDAA